MAASAATARRRRAAPRLSASTASPTRAAALSATSRRIVSLSRRRMASSTSAFCVRPSTAKHRSRSVTARKASATSPFRTARSCTSCSAANLNARSSTVSRASWKSSRARAVIWAGFSRGRRWNFSRSVSPALATSASTGTGVRRGRCALDGSPGAGSGRPWLGTSGSLSTGRGAGLSSSFGGSGTGCGGRAGSGGGTTGCRAAGLRLRSACGSCFPVWAAAWAASFGLWPRHRKKHQTSSPMLTTCSRTKTTTLRARMPRGGVRRARPGDATADGAASLQPPSGSTRSSAGPAGAAGWTPDVRRPAS